MLTFEQFIARHTRHDATDPNFVINHILLNLEETCGADDLAAVHVYRVDDDESNDLHGCEFDNNGVLEFTLETYNAELKACGVEELHKITYAWYCTDFA